jgi:hypothetical protein
MTAPTRPIFRNGQRLTAERLTEALEFLRNWVRRISLGPLSSGVAAGLELSPGINQTGDIGIAPGLAIDGRGRLLVLEVGQTFTRANIEAFPEVGLLNPGDVVRVQLVLDDAGTPLDPCQTDTPLRVVENVRIVFSRDGFLDNANDPSTLAQARACVNPWEDLDTPAGAACGVILGHAIVNSSNQLTASRRFRQGVSPRLGVIYGSSGKPSIAVGEMKVDFADDRGAFVADAAAVSVPALFTEEVRFVKSIVADSSRANFAQATVLAPFTTPYFTASVWPEDNRVLALMGGTGDPFLAAPGSGLVAVSYQLDDSDGGTVESPGEPLFMQDIAINNAPKVSRKIPNEPSRLIGLSAARNTIANGVRFVPVAVAGLVKVKVEHLVAGINVGDELTAHPSTAGLLVPASPSGGTTRVVARAAQSVPTSGANSNIYAWVVQPPQRI